jgi:hypothetical protein
MSFPGFAAEAALQQVSAHHRLAWAPDQAPLAARVVPAKCFPDGCGPCMNGIQFCCEDGFIRKETCPTTPPPQKCKCTTTRCCPGKPCTTGGPVVC